MDDTGAHPVPQERVTTNNGAPEGPRPDAAGAARAAIRAGGGRDARAHRTR